MKRNRTKHSIVIAISILFIFSIALGACSPAAPSPAQPEATEAVQPTEGEQGEITVLYLDDPPFWKEQAQRFTEATGIKVNWIGIPFSQLHNDMLTAFAGGDSPYDVIHVRDDYVAEFGSRGFLMPLEDRITADIKNMMPSRAWENLSWDNHNYGVPRYFWMWQFYYNTEMFDNAGVEAPPKTWAELADLAEVLTQDTDGDGNIDQWGYCEAWGENLVFHPFQLHLLAAGGRVLDDSGKPAFNSEEGKRALQWMVDMAQTDNYCPAAYELMNSGALAELFAQGNIAMIANSTQTFRIAADPSMSNVVDKVSAALAPGDKEPSATFSETGGLAIPASSKNPDLAWEYIKFVTSVDEEKRMAMELSSIPTATDALLDPEVQSEYPNFQYVQEQMEHPFGMIKHPNAAEVDRLLAIHIVSALQGQETVDEALQNAEQEILAITE